MNLPMLPALAALALAPLSGPVPTGDGAAAHREPSVLRAYDLMPALPGSMQRGGWETLLPYLGGNRGGDAEEWDPMNGSDTVIDLLRSLCGDEFEYEDRSIRLTDQGRMYVRAPEALQKRTQAYLAFLERVFGASLELRIDAVELPEGSASEAVPALLATADADKIIARGGRGGVRTWKLRLRAGDAAGLDLTRTSSMVTDYNVEIAQASAIADPIVDDVAVGTRLFARAAPSSGGTWLSLVLRRGDPLGGVVNRDVLVESQVNTTDRVVNFATARAYQNVDVLNRSLALDTYLPENRVLAIQSAIASDTKMRSEVLLLRRESGSLPIFEQVNFDPLGEKAGGKLLFLNGESIAPPRCLLDTTAMPKDHVPGSWAMRKYEDPNATDSGVFAEFAQDNLDLLRDQLGSDESDVEIRNVGPCLLVSRGASSAKRDAPLLPGREGSSPDVLDRLAPAPRVAQVSLTLRRAGAAAPIARASLPVRFGESGCMVLGTEGFELADYDVEVAQSASVADSQIRIAFDGLALRVRPVPTSSGDLVLDLLARAHVRRGESKLFELGVPALGAIDESTHDQMFVRERLVFGKGENAPKRFVLGEVAEGSTAGALTLEVEASEAK
jgi:hypothetical protein